MEKQDMKKTWNSKTAAGLIQSFNLDYHLKTKKVKDYVAKIQRGESMDGADVVHIAKVKGQHFLLGGGDVLQALADAGKGTARLEVIEHDKVDIAVAVALCDRPHYHKGDLMRLLGIVKPNVAWRAAETVLRYRVRGDRKNLSDDLRVSAKWCMNLVTKMYAGSSGMPSLEDSLKYVGSKFHHLMPDHVAAAVHFILWTDLINSKRGCSTQAAEQEVTTFFENLLTTTGAADNPFERARSFMSGTLRPQTTYRSRRYRYVGLLFKTWNARKRKSVQEGAIYFKESDQIPKLRF
jgi:hypothetical protein